MPMSAGAAAAASASAGGTGCSSAFPAAGLVTHARMLYIHLSKSNSWELSVDRGDGGRKSALHPTGTAGLVNDMEQR